MHDDQTEHMFFCNVNAEWDEEASVWVASSDDVPGLATGADTLEALADKLKVVIPELLEANDFLSADVTAVGFLIRTAGN